MATWNGTYSETDHDGYNEIDVTGHLSIEIDEGETFGNYIFDVRGEGNSCTVSTTQWEDGSLSSFTLHNLGWRGKTPPDAPEPLRVGCSSNARIEQVYLGDGMRKYPVSSAWRDHAGAMRAAPSHSGHLAIVGVYAENWIHGGLDLSLPGTSDRGQDGSFTVRDCHLANNQIANLRVGTRMTVGNTYISAGEADHRGMWVRGRAGVGGGNYGISYGGSYTEGGRSALYEVTVEGSSFDSQPAQRAIEAGEASSVTLDSTSYYAGWEGNGAVRGGTQTRNIPEFVPEGCPSSVLEAATGDIDSRSGRGVDYPGVPHVLRNVHVIDDSGDRVGVIARNGQVVVVDSEIEGEPPNSATDGGSVWSKNTNWGDDADPKLPDSVPSGVSEASGGTVTHSDPDSNR